MFIELQKFVKGNKIAPNMPEGETIKNMYVMSLCPHKGHKTYNNCFL